MQYTASMIRNMLNRLRFVDREDFIIEGYQITDREWELFRRNPHDQFVRCSDEMQEAIVRTMNRSMR